MSTVDDKAEAKADEAPEATPTKAVTTGRKFYYGISAASFVSDDVMSRTGLEDDKKNPLPFHMTMQYCGKDIDDMSADLILSAIESEMKGAALTPDDVKLTINPKFDLYGPPEAKNNLVVLCDVSDKFAKAVAAVRDFVCETNIDISKPSFEFSAHITLGEATEIPDAATAGGWDATTHAFDTITAWGPDGEVRGTVRIPLQDPK